ncbi:MAG: hypothetical protein M1416_02630 [Candidatus Pacearchaeota archaeon]|nr:hypothetical protein [Candidatus Pacearchaeota archaeon]
MEKQKRITIFAPEIKDREEIGLAVESYFKKEFGTYFDDLQIQKYAYTNDPKKEDDYLGHWNEVLAVFDQRFVPKEKRCKDFKNTIYFKSLKASHEMSINLCKDKNIPYVIYRGEITKKQEYLFVMEINNLKGKIKDRLEGLITSD